MQQFLVIIRMEVLDFAAGLHLNNTCLPASPAQPAN